MTYTVSSGISRTSKGEKQKSMDIDIKRILFHLTVSDPLLLFKIFQKNDCQVLIFSQEYRVF